MSIRHTPFLGATLLFSKEVLKEISDEQRNEDRHTAIAIVVRKGQPQSSTSKDCAQAEGISSSDRERPSAEEVQGSGQEATASGNTAARDAQDT